MQAIGAACCLRTGRLIGIPCSGTNPPILQKAGYDRWVFQAYEWSYIFVSTLACRKLGYNPEFMLEWPTDALTQPSGEFQHSPLFAAIIQHHDSLTRLCSLQVRLVDIPSCFRQEFLEVTAAASCSGHFSVHRLHTKDEVRLAVPGFPRADMSIKDAVCCMRGLDHA